MELVLRSFLMLSLLVLSHACRKAQKVRTSPGSKTMRLVLDPSVMSHIPTVSASAVANLSLSPWTYRDSYDPSRLPARIFHAHCLTSGCLSLQGDGEDLALIAKPICYQVPVLYRVERNRSNKKEGTKTRRRYVFRLGTEKVVVGCTCVRPSVVQQP
ncbi:interleukin 17a/f3 [Cheilinus undulatus]|uniref:interleukin 17a/f3 n=1 Tax=Cheilinus undulatus TaxID=241271 RepID=UPI001BD2BBFE|nr:interleukin 17a/f3 [Cheilinus undulatus]